MTGSGRGPAPSTTPLWAQIAALAADPATTRYPRSARVLAASAHAISGSAATAPSAGGWGVR